MAKNNISIVLVTDEYGGYQDMTVFQGTNALVHAEWEFIHMLKKHEPLAKKFGNSEILDALDEPEYELSTGGRIILVYDWRPSAANRPKKWPHEVLKVGDEED